jgi:hypothetical protein
MGRGAVIGRALRDAVDLRALADASAEGVLRSRLDEVARRRIEDVGPSVPKTRAAELLGVSLTALERWVERGAVPVVRSARSSRTEIETEAVVDLAVEVNSLREAGQRRGLLATALERRAAQARRTQPPAMGTKEFFPDQRGERRRDFELLSAGERVAQAVELSRTGTRIAAAASGARRTRPRS